MPLLFSLGQHAALQVIDSDLNDNEFLLAFLDDVCIVTTADRVGEVFKSLNKHLRLSGTTDVLGWSRRVIVAL